MLATYLAALLTISASLLVGRAVTLVCGRGAWVGIEPAVGFAAIVALLGLLARFPGNLEGLTTGLAVLVIGSIIVLFSRRRQPDTLSLTRSPWFWASVAVAVALTAVPFLISGRWGLLGMGYNNDLGLHLAWAQSLRSDFGTAPSAGYPLGPHGFATSLTSLPHLSLNVAFIGLLIAIPVLCTMTAWTALANLGPRRRMLAAVMVAFSYLTVSYFAQAAFKETATAMFLLAFTIYLPTCLPLPAGRRDRLKTIGPLLALLGGILFTFSFPGLVFPAVVTVAWLLSNPEFRSRLRPSRLGHLLARPLILVGLAVTAVTMLVFAFAGQFGFAGAFSEVSQSDAFGPVSAFEALGVWLTSDYRLDGSLSTPLPGLMAAIGVAALVLALIWWRHRPREIYPVAAIGLTVFYLVSLPWVGEYSSAKALAVISPLVMVTVLAALLSTPPGRASGMRNLRLAWFTFGATFVTLAFASSLLVLRDASVAPAGRAASLAAFQDEVAGQRVLYGDQDRFAPGYFPEADVSVPLGNFPEANVNANPKKPFETNSGQSAIDFDSFDAATLNRHDYVVTTAAPWSSKAPPFFELVDKAAFFKLWKRTGPAFGRPILGESALPAKLVDCGTEGGRYYSHLDGEAVLMPETVLGRADRWQPSSELAPGESSSIELELGSGRWQISIQYMAPQGMTLEAPGYERRFAPAIDGQRVSNQRTGSYGQFWPAGVIKVARPGPVAFKVTASEPSLLQQLTGYSVKTKFGRIALMRIGARVRVPMSEICGRWVDFFRRTKPDDEGAQAGTGAG